MGENDGAQTNKYAWTDRERLMRFQNYSPIVMLIDFVEKTRTKRFYESAERYEILMLMFIMRKGAPFCETRRFPEEYFANLSVGPIAEALDRLQAAIDIPDPQHMPIQFNSSDMNSSKQIFDTAMMEIRRFAHYTDAQKLADIGIYNRSTFEQHFGMRWGGDNGNGGEGNYLYMFKKHTILIMRYIPESRKIMSETH